MADLELGNAAPAYRKRGGSPEQQTDCRSGFHNSWIVSNRHPPRRSVRKIQSPGSPRNSMFTPPLNTQPKSRRQRAESESKYSARCPPPRQLAKGSNRPSPRHRRYPHGRTLILRRASHSTQTGQFRFRWPAGSEKLAPRRFSGRSALDPGFPRGITAPLLHGNSCGSGSGNPGRTARWVDSVARLGSHAAGENSPLEL